MRQQGMQGRVLLGWGWGALALALGLGSACSNDEALAPESGGHPGAGAGAGGLPSGGGGAGGEPSEPCGVQALASLCAAGECPRSLDGVEYACSPGEETTSFSSSCGGISVRAKRADGETVWYFDAEGALVGAELRANGAACAERYGEECVPTSSEQDVCGWRESCPPHPLEDYCVPGRGAGCPSIADACAERSGDTEVTGYRSSRGYTVWVEGDLWGVFYCFDRGGSLIGVRSGGDLVLPCSDGTLSSDDTYGENCGPVGEPDNEVCAVVGGQAGAGGQAPVGGAGGAAGSGDGGGAGQPSGGAPG